MRSIFNIYPAIVLTLCVSHLIAYCFRKDRLLLVNRAKVSLAELTPQQAITYTKLQQKLEFNSSRPTLENLLITIEKSYRIQMEIDWPSLKADGISKHDIIILNTRSETIEQALMVNINKSDALSQDKRYEVDQSGTLFIGSSSWVTTQTLEWRIYNLNTMLNYQTPIKHPNQTARIPNLPSHEYEYIFYEPFNNPTERLHEIIGIAQIYADVDTPIPLDSSDSYDLYPKGFCFFWATPSYHKKLKTMFNAIEKEMNRMQELP